MRIFDGLFKRIVIIFLIIILLWFLFSNIIIFSLFTEVENYNLIKEHVDWAFVIFSFILLYFLINREFIKRNYKKADIEAEQNLYRTIFDTAHDAIYLLNDRYEFVDCNKEALDMFQCTKEQIIGKKPIDVSPDFQFGEVKSEMLSIEKMNQTKNGKPQFFEWLHTNLKKDKLFFTEVSLNRLVISGEIFLLAIIRDISKRKKAENTLTESEKKYRRLTENSPNITYIYSVNRGALYWSSKVKDILGFDSENLLNDTLKWGNSIHPEDRPKIKLFFTNIQVGKSYEIEYRIYDIHKKIHWFYDRIFNVRGEDGDIILEGIISDITKQKETEHILKISEEKYKAQYDYFPIPIYTIKKKNADLYFADVNNAAKKYPFVKAEEIIGRNVTDFVQSKEEMVLLDVLNETFKIKQDQKLEMAYRFKTTGVKRNITAVIGFVPPDSVLLSTIDITDKRNAQQKVYHAMINAEERERSRIAKELHDGVSPILSATKLYIQTLLNLKDEKARGEISNKINNTINEAIQSVSDISNKLSPHILQNFGLSTAIQSFFDKITEITNIHHSFFYNINSKLDEDIEVNIYRILVELINNTVKYANAKNIIINIQEKGDVIKIFYEQNGNGFDIEEVRNKSKGMGLYNLDNRINLLNGDFDIESDIKTGLKIKITIPLNIIK
jgi:PAS domain S-box-containing protein